MTLTNVLPSASEYSEQIYPMHEIKQINAEDFRLKNISDLETELSNKADHYRQVAKKIQKNALNDTPLSCGSWVNFCWAFISNPGNSFDRVWYCCKPCACWRCDCFRFVVCWVYCHE